MRIVAMWVVLMRAVLMRWKERIRGWRLWRWNGWRRRGVWMKTNQIAAGDAVKGEHRPDILVSTEIANAQRDNHVSRQHPSDLAGQGTLLH